MKLNIDSGSVLRILDNKGACIETWLVLGFQRDRLEDYLNLYYSISNARVFQQYIEDSNKNIENMILKSIIYMTPSREEYRSLNTTTSSFNLEKFSNIEDNECLYLSNNNDIHIAKQYSYLEIQNFVLKNKILGNLDKLDFSNIMTLKETKKYVYDYIKNFNKIYGERVKYIISSERENFKNIISKKQYLVDNETLWHTLSSYRTNYNSGVCFLTFTNRYMYLYSMPYNYKGNMNLIGRESLSDMESCFRLYLSTKVVIPNYFGKQVNSKDIKGNSYVVL